MTKAASGKLPGRCPGAVRTVQEAALETPGPHFWALAGWAMGGSYRVAAPVKPAGEQLRATSFTWNEFGCLC